jgi:hypothetical protein
MITFLKRRLDTMRGSGEAAVTVPSLDGALRPNQLLDRAEVVREVPAPDVLAVAGDRVLCAAGPVVVALADGAELHRFDSDVSALAAGPEGVLAVGLNGGGVRFTGGPHAGEVPGGPYPCPTALMFDGAGVLWIANGSQDHAPDHWKHDLMSRGASGSVWRVDLAGGRAERVMDGLAWPFGLGLSPQGLILTEAWRHRVSLRRPDGAVTHPLADLPGYPARIAPSGDGGWWLAVFAPRNQLTEFILREPAFRARMMAEIDPAFWAAPALEATDSFMRPLQGGAQKHLGVVKPWAPTLSYGLVIRLDEKLHPLFSQHSRADGRRHGITSVVEAGGRVYAASKGGDVILALDMTKGRAGA